MATSCSSLDELASLRVCVCTWWWSLKLGGHYLLCCLALGKDKTYISLFSPELGLSVESLCVLYFSSELLFAFEKTGNDSSFFSSSSMECLLDSKRVRQSARVTDRTDNIAWWNVKSRVWKCLVKSVSFFFLSSFLSEGEGGDRVSPNHLWYCQRPKNGGMFLVAFSSSFTPEMDKNPLVDVLSTCLVEE